jgi:hypothetical protein
LSWFGKNSSERFNKATMKSVSRANTLALAWTTSATTRRIASPTGVAYLLRARAHGFALRHNVRPYPAGVAVVVACAAVISIRIYQQLEHVQVAVENSPVPSTPPANAEREFNLAPPAVPRTFNAEPILLPRSRDVPVLPVLPSDALGSDEFVPLNLEREALDDQPLLEK